MRNRLVPLLCLPLALSLASPAGAAELSWSLDAILQHVQPLKHDATGRLPMVTWPAIVKDAKDTSFNEKKPLPPEAYRELARRGLTQRIPMNADFILMAQAIQAAGAKVIFVEGNAGNGPYDLAPEPLHQLPADYKLAKDEPRYPCPALLAGWAKKADQVRETLRKFREAGVTVDAAWLDWEVEPWGWPEAHKQAQLCPRCRSIMPKAALATFEGYRRYTAALRADLFSAYAAAPIREIYPACSVTDWSAVYSTPELPTASCWGNRTFHPRGIGFLTAANPVAYGNDIYYQYHWKKEWGWPLDVPHMDRVYTQIMLSQVSQNAENMQTWAPDRQCIPWVCRYCPDDDDPKVPLLSRERYREILRHLWLRGADGMQVFNEPRPKYPAIAIEELQDAVGIYDEMLEYRRFLEDGEIMNTAVPEAAGNGAIWSGLRLETEAVVRAFTQSDTPVVFSVTPWPGTAAVQLQAPPGGASWRLVRDQAKVNITPLATPPPPAP